MVKEYIFVLFLASTFCPISSINPGFKARITSKGLKYATDVALDTLKKKLVGSSIPDQHGKTGDVSYELTNLKVTDFVNPTEPIQLSPPTGLKWDTSGTGMELTGDWKYTYKKGWIKITDNGRFTISVSGLSFDLQIILGKDGHGRPNIRANGCDCNINSVDITFHGGASWIYNIFKDPIGNTIKGILSKQMCNAINDAVDKNAEKALQTLKVTTNIGNIFMLDYRLVTKPAFTASFMETYHKGEVFWSGNATKEAPIPVPPMPDMGDSDRMLYLWVTDYLFNTMAYQAQIHGVLKYTLTAKDLPPSSRGTLNTTCLSFDGFCIGELIPQIAKKYPNRQVELRLSSTRAPVMTALDGRIQVVSGGTINMYTSLPKNPSVFLVSLNATMNTTLNMSISNEKIYAKIQNLDFHLTVSNSSVGDISDKALQFVVNGALKLFVEPRLNALGQNGFPLPSTGDVQFVNTKLVLAKDTLIIGTDVTYSQKEDTLLKFVPAKRLRLDNDSVHRLNSIKL